MPFIFPVIGSNSTRRELWVAKRRVKMQGKEGGDLGCNEYVGLDNSFLPPLAGEESLSPVQREVGYLASSQR